VITERACELARAWTGAKLAAQVRAASSAADSDVSAVVLLANAAVTQPMP
jgi:hypothetical protein